MRLSVVNFLMWIIYILHNLGNNVDRMSTVLQYKNKIISIYQKCEVIPNKVSKGLYTHAHTYISNWKRNWQILNEIYQI